MYEYFLKKFLTKQIEVVFPGVTGFSGRLIVVDTTGVVVQRNNDTNEIVMIPFSSGAIFTADTADE